MSLKTSKSHIHSAKPLSSINVSRNPLGKRRSNRMNLHTMVGLSGEDRQKSSFTMPVRATHLNKHGAAVQLKRELPLGSVVILKNKQGAQISARVVAQINAFEGTLTYGVEFVEQEQGTNFWGITFPTGPSGA